MENQALSPEVYDLFYSTPKGTLFELSREVENPRPDRRMTRDWRFHPTWASGVLFRLSEFDSLDREEAPMRLLKPVRGLGTFPEAVPVVRSAKTHNSAVAHAILPHLRVYQPKDVLEALKTTTEYWTEHQLLMELAHRGHFGIDDVLAIVQTDLRSYQSDRPLSGLVADLLVLTKQPVEPSAYSRLQDIARRHEVQVVRILTLVNDLSLRQQEGEKLTRNEADLVAQYDHLVKLHVAYGGA